jgi:hypothetical protein
MAADPENRVRFPAQPEKSESGTESTQPREYNWGAAPVYKTENTAVGIRHDDHVTSSIRKSWQLLRRQAAVARSV